MDNNGNNSYFNNPGSLDSNMNQGFNQGGFDPNMNQGFNQGGFDPNMNQGFNQGGFDPNMNQGYNQGGFNPNMNQGFNPNMNQGFNPQPMYNNNMNGYAQQPTYGQMNSQPQGSGVCCPNCGSNNLQVLQDISTSGKDFKGGSACCGALLFGPIGILCGSCGKGKQTKTTHYWLCANCGNKFKV